MNISMLIANPEYTARDQPRGQCQWAVIDGLRALGHTIEFDRPDSGVHISKCKRPDTAFIWNGMKGQRIFAVNALREAGVPVYVMERGFFDRFNYTQISSRGFNHTASWASTLDDLAPGDGKERFQAVRGDILPTTPREDGYVLILGQVQNDSQLSDSEIHHPKLLIGAVEDAMPTNIPLRFRPHPLYPWRGNPHVERSTGTLEEDIAGARFVVTINSNAGNEALALGCPVLCLGPALYAMTGVALQTTLAMLGRRIGCMLGGWHPPQTLIDNYLYHLACRQYGLDELRRGECLRKIMEN